MTEWQANMALTARARPLRPEYAIRRESDGRIVGSGYGSFGIAYDVAQARRQNDGERYTVEQVMH